MFPCVGSEQGNLEETEIRFHWKSREDGVLSWCCLIWCLLRSGRSTDKVLFRARKYQCMLTLRSEQTKWEAVFNYKEGL